MDFPGPFASGGRRSSSTPSTSDRVAARHGFKRILFLNGHGSNIRLIDMAARLCRAWKIPEACWRQRPFYLTSDEGMQVVETSASRAPAAWDTRARLETSIYLAIDPEAVFMDKAVDENSFPEGKHSHMDWSDGPLAVMPWWNAISHTGVHGDATKATADKGEALLAAAVKECVEFVQELKERAAPVRWGALGTSARVKPHFGKIPPRGEIPDGHGGNVPQLSARRRSMLYRPAPDGAFPRFRPAVRRPRRGLEEAQTERPGEAARSWEKAGPGKGEAMFRVNKDATHEALTDHGTRRP